eukprot:g8774.t2
MPRSRNHDPLQLQQGDDRRPRHRRRRARFSLNATVAGEDASTTTSRLGELRSGRSAADGDDDVRTRGKLRFAAMMQLLPTVAAKVNVARVLKKLRDEGAEMNLRTYRGCLEFLARGGRGQEALMYLQEMESAGIAADSSCLGHVATACAKGQDLDTALAVVRGMLSKGHNVSRTYNNIMLAIVNGQAFNPMERNRTKFRRAALSSSECDRAVELLREMKDCGVRPSVFTYNLLIAALARSRRPNEEVLGLLEQMREDGASPDSYTYVGVVYGLQGPDRDRLMRQVLDSAKAELTVKSELSAVYSAVVSGFAKSASWRDAEELVDEMFANNVPRDEYTYCAAMNACKEAGKWREAAAFLPKMKADGVPPNTIAYNTAIGACAFFGKANKAWNNNRRSSSFVRPTSTKPVEGALSPVQTETTNAGDFAVGLMEEMKQEGIEMDVITYGSLMSALSPRGAAGADAVLELFEALEETEITPNSITYVAAIRAYGDKGDWKKAEEMLVEMKDVHGLDPNRFCYSAVIKALAKGGQWKRALQKLDEMRERGLSADPVVYTAAIGACEKYGQWEKALETLSKLVAEKPPVYSLMWGYNAAISALGKAKQMGGVKDLLATMKASGLKPDEYTYAAMMRAAGLNGFWEESLSMLEEMETEGVRPNLVVYNTLIASLLKGDQNDKANAMLKRMRDGGVPPDVTTYTTILSGCKRDVDWKRAEALLAEMDSVGIKPNSRTLTAVLKVYGDAGEVERAVALFEECDAAGLDMDVPCFNALMGAVLKKDHADKVLEVYGMMEKRGVEPDGVTESMVLRAAEQTGAAEWAWVLMEKLREAGGVSMHVYADAIRACSATPTAEGKEEDVKDGRREDGDCGVDGSGVQGQRVVATEPGSGAVRTRGWTGSHDSGAALQRALDLFNEARQIYEGENICRLYTSVFMACAREAGTEGAEAARSLLDEMRASPFPPDKAAFGPAASALAAGGGWEDAIEVLQEGADAGAAPNGIAYEDVRAMAEQKGQLEAADERLGSIVYAEIDADTTADGSTTSSSPA